MTEIKAFVAHSFTTGNQDTSNPKDEWVVGEFAKLFEQIQKLTPSFSWERANEAQPRGVTEKVLSAWQDKNLFIAICTKKERIIPDAFNHLAQFDTLTLESVSWKTSDWIIQEIGFAIGRGCKIVILLEAGVRRPGGLIGDLECIEFDRNSPSSCFVKLMQMINNAGPKERTALSLSNVSLPETPKQDELISDEIDWAEPRPSWGKREYRIAFHLACMGNNNQLAQGLHDAYLNSDEGKDEIKKQVWEAYCEWQRLEYGLGGNLERLKYLASSNRDESDILQYLALALSHFDLHKESAQTYDAASKVSNSSDGKLIFLGQAIVERAREGKTDSEIACDIELLKKATNAPNGGELTLLRVLEKIYREKKDLEAAFLIQHRLAYLDPSDVRTRFSLAYEHDNKGNPRLSLFHYAKLAPLERDGVTWNNLGAVYNNLVLKALAVQSYRKAQELGETLAMSNLAFRFLAEGFYHEAKEICETAMSMPSYHPNVLTALSMANSILENNTEKADEILKSVTTIKLNQFLSECGRAISYGTPDGITGKWITPECEITVKIEENEFSAEGRFEKEFGGGLGSLLAPANSAIPVYTDTWRVEYKGAIRGKVVIGRVTRKREEENTTVLGSMLNSVQALLLLSDNASEFEVMERPTETAPMLYKIQRIASVIS